MVDKPRENPGHSSVPGAAASSRLPWLLAMFLAAGLVSGLAGLLSHAAGNNVPGAVLTGGGAFAGTVGLLLGIAHYARPQ